MPIASFKACDLSENYTLGVNTAKTTSSSSGSSGGTFVDSDNDGLGDSVEEEFEMNVRSSDSDEDGFGDGLEFVSEEGDPLSRNAVPTAQRRVRNLTTAVASIGDGDGDGLGDSIEETNELDPGNADTDGDGYADGLEMIAESNPFDEADSPQRDSAPQDDLLPSTGTAPPDADRDGISDAQEARVGGSPGSADTDRDGYSDGLEFLVGSDPENELIIPNFNFPDKPETSTSTSSTTTTTEDPDELL